jgi:hypothetical protein
MARLTSKGRPGFGLAVKAYCRDCVNFQRIDCEIVTCALYYWQPYRKKEPDLSWVEVNAYSSRENYESWIESRKTVKRKPKLKLKNKTAILKLKVKKVETEKEK